MNDSKSQAVKLVAADGARADIQAYGAQVTSWVPAGALDNRLFLSRASDFRPGAAIRGGVPVIFPQFGAEGALTRHGFARTSIWEAVGEEGGALARFRLADSEATRALWPHAFEAIITVAIGGAKLNVTLAVRNTGDTPLSFTAALHTYLHVASIGDVTVRGLQGLRFRDSAAGGAERVQAAGTMRIDGEVDRVYFDAPTPVEVLEPARTTRVEASGFPDVVVWNPGATRAAALPGLDAGGYKRMLCVEAAVIGKPVTLAPGASWTGSQTLIAD